VRKEEWWDDVGMEGWDEVCLDFDDSVEIEKGNGIVRNVESDSEVPGTRRGFEDLDMLVAVWL